MEQELCILMGMFTHASGVDVDVVDVHQDKLVQKLYMYMYIYNKYMVCNLNGHLNQSLQDDVIAGSYMQPQLWVEPLPTRCYE